MNSGLMLEIRRGKIVRRLEGNGLQLATKDFWKSPTALGGAETLCDNNGNNVYKGMPWRSVRTSTVAPAVRFKMVDVVTQS